MLMLWLKSFHLVFVVTWFSGLFYLPRLYVYHAMSDDSISINRFKIMERKLFWGITTPSAILATILGFSLIMLNPSYYMSQGWMHVKLSLIVVLWGYHYMCYKFLRDFATDNNTKSHVYYRWFNELPVFLLIGIIVLVIVKPF